MDKVKRKRKKTNLAVNKLFSIRLTWQKPRKVWLASLGALLSYGFLTTVSVLPAVSADRIAFSYGIFGEFYVSISDLEIFAKEGKITPSLEFYADRISDENLAKLRDLLNRSLDINEVTASIVLNLPLGQQLIEEISSIINSPSKISQPALRGALILAAAQPEGLTILNVLRFYSPKTLNLNTKQIAEAVNEATGMLANTERVFAALEREAIIQAKKSDSVDVNTLSDLNNSGSKKWRKESLVIKLANYRQTEGVVYLPVATNQPVPLVVIAPGLNTNWQSFTYLAEHLASYGFGVATLNFPGTNPQRIDAVLNGLDTPPADNQWLEQPKIIIQLLDEIERKSQSDPIPRYAKRLVKRWGYPLGRRTTMQGNAHQDSDPVWQGKLNLQRVGIIGQSLGGYTAMAIAGAKIDWQHLQKECQKLKNPEQINFNPALFWQCQGAAASSPATDLQDERVVAAIAVNPVTNPIFSESGISQLRSPIMMITGDKDFFAPALDEQIVPFTWLADINKYLVLVKNSTHFSFIEGESDETELSSQISGADPTLARSYLKVLSLAFFQTHLAEQNEFVPYLTETYLKSLSKQPLPINLLRSLDSDRLRQLIDE